MCTAFLENEEHCKFNPPLHHSASGTGWQKFTTITISWYFHDNKLSQCPPPHTHVSGPSRLLQLNMLPIIYITVIEQQQQQLAILAARVKKKKLKSWAVFNPILSLMSLIKRCAVSLHSADIWANVFSCLGSCLSYWLPGFSSASDSSCIHLALQQSWKESAPSYSLGLSI